MKRLVAGLLCVSWVSGCSFSAAQTARTSGAGNVQVGLEPGVFAGFGGGSQAVLPTLDVAVRVGVSDKVDVGGRLGSSVAELQSKFQLTPDDGPIVSIAPRLSYYALSLDGSKLSNFSVPVPVLIDLPVTDNSAVVLGPSARFTRLSSSVSAGGNSASATANYLSGGLSLGYVAKVQDGIRLLPELAVESPLLVLATSTATTGDATAEADVNVGALLTSVRFNILFGKTK